MVVLGKHLKKGFSSRGRGARFFSQSLRSWKKSAGFTILELLIVIGITAALSVVSVGFYANHQKVKILENTAQEITSYLHYAQQKSVSQEQGLQWGVHFDNPTSGSDFYALYTGTTYSSPIETKYLPNGIEFQTPTPGSSTDASYEKLTGLLYGGSYQQITLINASGLTKNILTCQQGLISYNADISVCGGIDTTPPVVSSVTASNTSYSSYVDSPFDLSANINEAQGGVSSCEYTINGGTNWYSANFSGTGPDYTCSKTNITSSDDSSLTLNMRATSNGGTGAGSSISRTVDAVAPTCSDDWTDNWTINSPVSITITSNDTGSSIASTKYCVDTINTCSPSTSYTVPVAVSCNSGSTCIQYIRYAAWDNVNNVSSVYSKRVRQDLQAPTDGILTTDPGNTQVSTSWTVASDSGSGLATSDTYKLVFSTSSSPTVNCTSDTQIYTGTSASYLHSDLTNGTTYYYRVCAFDAVSNMSTGSTASSTPHLLANGEVCSFGSDCTSGYCYIDEDGDRYAPASGTTKCQANSQIAGVDCCDSDSRAYPGESTYYTTINNCSSWDYDCSGAENKNTDCAKQTVTKSSPNTCYNHDACGYTAWTRYVNCTENSAGTASCGQSHSYHYCHSNICYGYNVDLECVAGSPGVYDDYSTSKTCGCK